MPAHERGLIPEPLPPGVVLTEEQIRELVHVGELIDPATFDDRGLDACSYDVRIGDKGIIGGSALEIDLNKEPLIITPGGYAAVISLESVKIPNNLLVRINTKRSVAYQGIALLTGTQIDPGYRGHLLFGFYNTSSRKVVLGRAQPICSLTFEPLGADVARPKPADPSLLKGDFPARFVSDMANMEVLSWQDLSAKIQRLDQISHEIIELRNKYDRVMEPIATQTKNIDKLTLDVQRLHESIEVVAKSAEKHRDRVSLLSEKISGLSTQQKAFWAILLVLITVLLTWSIAKMFDSASASKGAALTQPHETKVPGPPIEPALPQARASD